MNISRRLKVLFAKVMEVITWSIAAVTTRILPADEALRFLFRLDAKLYALEGSRAIAYGEGVHTKHRHIGYHNFFVNRISEGEKVLDIGCGNGALANDIILKTGADVVGIDIDHKNITLARKNYHHPKLKFMAGNALFDIPKGSFEVVVMSNVLEHLDNRSNFLRDIIKSIKPKRILIRVPLFERDWRVPLKAELGIDFRLDKTHRIEYTIDGFNSEMREAGLTIQEKEIHWGEIWAVIVPEQKNSL